MMYEHILLLFVRFEWHKFRQQKKTKNFHFNLNFNNRYTQKPNKGKAKKDWALLYNYDEDSP